MTKRISVEPILPSAVTVEPVAAEQTEQASPRVFDFTQPVELLDDAAKSVYYRLRRVALMAADGEFLANQGRGDAKRLPDGKTYTEAEVVEILGPDYLNGLVIDKKCCC
jgi:hypothetical protein